MDIINIHDAKTHFSKLIDNVVKGAIITIAKAGKPIAILKSIESKPNKINFGILKHRIKIKDNFDDYLSNEIISDFEGR